jgi:Lon-like ATP-dependent protease
MPGMAFLALSAHLPPPPPSSILPLAHLTPPPIPPTKEKEGVSITPAALRDLIHSYCRESGVRQLKKLIEKIYRKAAFKRVEQKEAMTRVAELIPSPTPLPDITVGPADLREFAGMAPYTKEKMYEITPPGVVMGLAWTPMGKVAACLPV